MTGSRGTAANGGAGSGDVAFQLDAVGNCSKQTLALHCHKVLPGHHLLTLHKLMCKNAEQAGASPDCLIKTVVPMKAMIVMSCRHLSF